MPQPYVRLLTTTGDGVTGDSEMTGDYSGAPAEFYLQGPTRDESEYGAVISRVLIYVEDSGAFDAAKYGNGVTLTNGITLEHRTSDDVLISSFTPNPVKSNGDWASLAFDAQVQSWGTGNEFLTVRYTFAKFSGGDDPGLLLDDGEKLVCTVNDDLSGLVAHRITAQGHRAEQ